VRESKNRIANSREIPNPLLDILSREHTPSILIHLLRSPNSTASETAGVLGIHIATAQKYLEALEKAGVVNSRERPSKPRTAREYELVDTTSRLERNIERMAEEEEGAGGRDPYLGEIMIREKARSDVAYEWDDEGQRITTIMFFRKGMRRRMEKKVVLTTEEGRFLWCVPFQSESFMSAEEIVEKAGVELSPVKVVEMIGRFRELDVIIVAKGGTRSG